MSALAILIFFDTALLAAGIIAFYLGVEALVEGASRLAIDPGLRAAIVGVTIVAFATTTPELFVAALNGLGYNSDLGLGVIVGSNITNVGLALGISALIEPVGVSAAALRQHVPFMIATAIVLVALGMDGNLSTVDGGALLLILVTFTGYLLYRTRSTTVDAIDAGEIDIEDEGKVSMQFKSMVYLVLGLLLLFVDSSWLIQSGQGLLGSFGFGPRFIELAVFAFGTSLPELAASVINTVRGESELSIGNIVGSNIYNVVAIPSILAVMVPVNVPPSITSLDFSTLLVFTFGVIMLMLRNRDTSHLDSGILVIGYLVFFWLILP